MNASHYPDSRWKNYIFRKLDRVKVYVRHSILFVKIEIYVGSEESTESNITAVDLGAVK